MITLPSPYIGQQPAAVTFYPVAMDAVASATSVVNVTGTTYSANMESSGTVAATYALFDPLCAMDSAAAATDSLAAAQVIDVVMIAGAVGM